MFEIIHLAISEFTNTIGIGPPIAITNTHATHNFGFQDSDPVLLSKPRFAIPDEDQPNGEGSLVRSWPGYDVAFAIDGNKGHDGTDNAAHPERNASNASFFVDLVKASSVAYVKVWPRILDLEYEKGYYEGMRLYAGSTLCASKEIYSKAYVINTLIPNQEPLLFICPQGTLAAMIQLTRGYNGNVQLAEIEVFIVRSIGICNRGNICSKKLS